MVCTVPVYAAPPPSLSAGRAPSVARLPLDAPLLLTGRARGRDGRRYRRTGERLVRTGIQGPREAPRLPNNTIHKAIQCQSITGLSEIMGLVRGTGARLSAETRRARRLTRLRWMVVRWSPQGRLQGCADGPGVISSPSVSPLMTPLPARNSRLTTGEGRND